MIPASMSVDGEHAATYRQQHGSPITSFSLYKILSSKYLHKECSFVINRTKNLKGLIVTVFGNMSGCLKSMIEGEANEYSKTRL